MTDTDDPTPPARRWWPASRRRRTALIAALLLSAGFGALWVERQPIVTHFIDREFARRGVPATYRIEDIGFGRQRLTGIAIGDRRRPDLAADRIDTQIGFGLNGPYLHGVEAKGVRLNARLANGRVSLGAIDQLLPAPSGKPFALPALRVKADDVQVRLTTPAGTVALAITGQGRLDNGFAGTVVARAPRLSASGCDLLGVSGRAAIRIDRARPHLTGPIAATRLACDTLTAADPHAVVDLTLSAALDRWQGRARVTTAAAAQGATRIAALTGTLNFAGTATQTGGRLDAIAKGLRAAPLTAASATVSGRYGIGTASRFDGRVHLDRAALDPALLARARSFRTAGAGTPVAPLLARAADALATAGRDWDADAQIGAATGLIALSRIMIDAASGARLTLAEPIALAGGSIQTPRALSLSGGGSGLPRFTLALTRAGAGAPIRGRAVIDPYAAGTARLALTPVVFTATPAGAVRLTTQATLSGPLGNGRVEGLTMPLVLDWAGGRLLANPACTPVALERLMIAGLTLDPARLRLCPTGGALVRVVDGRAQGGASLAATRLTGRLSSTPITVTMTGALLRLQERGFAIDGVEALLGQPDRQTRLTAATLIGMVAGGVVTGRFADAGGRIGNVPLILSAADGDWSLDRGVLALAGGLTVSDAAATPRFRPMAARDVAFRLAGADITATGTLHEPTTGTRVATVAIAHHLTDGIGHADLAVPALTFTKEFQPELLTPLTFGVIADVRGTVDGTARIGWSGQGVTSTGDFGTKAIDLAAAFGPVTGLATRMRFDDLLGLHSPPGQVATVRTVNPGIAVQDGTIRYQLLSNTQVQVEGARWPFAGGTLSLDPSRLDFSATGERRLTFRVEAARADQFLQQFDFSNLNATGVFDGVLPMIFDANGGRIEQGRLTMREGGGTIAYVGALGQEQLGLWGNLAFQALKSLRYRSLDVALNGSLGGEMVTDVRFAGVSQGAGAKSNFLIRRLQRLPLVFNLRIKAPFRGLLDSAQSFYDPRRLIQRNLPALLEQQNRANSPATIPPVQPSIQPSASENKR